LLAYRELDEALGLTTIIDSDLYDNRRGKNTQHSIAALLRQSIYSRLAAYEDTNDAERLCVDPAIRHVAEPKKIRDWSLRMLQVKFTKIGAKVVRHSRYVIFQMAEVAMPKDLFCEILQRIRLLALVPIPSGAG
jgi:hypothetical protein